MVEKGIIIKSINEAITKCSNDEVKSKLSGMSQDEKWDVLKNKLNPFEQKNYTKLLKDLEESEQMMEFDPINPYWKEDYDRYSKKIFQYEKRIITGYNLDKNKDNIPKYNINDYSEDTYEGMYDTKIRSVEQKQINNQQKINFTDGEIGSLRAYFGNDSARINSDLNHNYKTDILSGISYWGTLTVPNGKSYTI